MNTASRITRPLGWLLILALSLLSLWSTTGLMRKNDQATILAGAHDWARGDPMDWSRYYQFDKTYVLYAYTAAVLQIDQWLGGPRDPVRLTNRAIALTFWLALALFLFRHRRTLDPVWIIPLLTAPAILYNTQYLNSSTLSSAFLLFSLAAYPHPAAPILFFLAVGARADIILLLPLLCWLILPFPTIGKAGLKIFQRLEKMIENVPTIGKTPENSSNDWKNVALFASAGFAALLIGRLWAGGGGTNLDPFFNARMVAGYIVFGFGAATLVYGLMLVQLLRWRHLWMWVGALFLLLPVAFFIPQLHAPRYFWRGCEAMLMVAALMPALLAGVRGWGRVLIVSAAMVPLLVGVNAETLRQPRLTWSNPTVFPSGDGHYPMGAGLSFLGLMQRAGSDAEGEYVDHNQRVWQAVRGAGWDLNEAGVVPVAMSPMFGYLLLEGSLRGQRVDVRPAAQWGGAPYYVDSRTLMRADVKFATGALGEALNGDVEVVSPMYDGIGVLRVGTGTQAWATRTRLLSRLFRGNEYRIGSRDAVPSGRQVIWFGPAPFAGATQDAETGWFYREGGEPTAAAQRAWSALPAWMSVQSFGS
jgi:hypothetical protein